MKNNKRKDKMREQRNEKERENENRKYAKMR
jgi:hypothetical protein